MLLSRRLVAAAVVLAISGAAHAQGRPEWIDPEPVPRPPDEPRRHRIVYGPHARLPMLTRRVWVEVAATASLVIPGPSAYAQLIGLWGYGFTSMGQFALEGRVVAFHALVIGARIGYSEGGGGHAISDGAGLAMRSTEFGGVVGVLREWSGVSAIGGAGVQAEFGAAVLDVSLRGVSDTVLTTRAALIGFVRATVHRHGPRVVLRTGFQYVPYGAARAGNGDPAFAGFVVGIGVEQPL
jgi:hypothetical protein